MSNTIINNNNIPFFDSVTESQINLPTHINIIDKNYNLSGGKNSNKMYGGANNTFSETSIYSKQSFSNINDSETSVFLKDNMNGGNNINDSDSSAFNNMFGGKSTNQNNVLSDSSEFINNNQILSSTTSDIKSSSLIKNLTGGNLNNVESEMNIQKLIDMISSDSKSVNQNGGNDINKLLDMLTSDSNDSFKKYSDTNTTDLEKQLNSIINKNQSGGFNKNNINNLFVNDTNQCGGNNGLSVNQIKDFFNNLKLNGVDVHIKLDDHSMSEYFDLMQNTTTNIKQDGGKGINPSFQALIKLRKEVAKRFNIPNGPPAVKIASAMIKDIKAQNPSYDSVKAADEAIKNFDKISNKYKSMIKK